MTRVIWFARHVLALVLGLAGVVLALAMYFTKHDAGGAVAVLCGTALVCSMLVNE